MTRRILAVALVLAMAVVFAGIASADDAKTITGTLVSEDQLMANDGQEYMLENTEAAKDIEQYVDKKVEIKGTVMEKEGQKTIKVESIKPVE